MHFWFATPRFRTPVIVNSVTLLTIKLCSQWWELFFPRLIGLNHDTKSSSAPPTINAKENSSMMVRLRRSPLLASIVPMVMPKLRVSLLLCSDFTCCVKTALGILWFSSLSRCLSNDWSTWAISTLSSWFSLVVNCLSLQVTPLGTPTNYSPPSRQNRRCVMPVAICSLVILTARPMRYDQP